jgi:BirA family biotin operon repressor/biotin-[acetyl-CoA-carboxylase] ligase
MVEFDRQKFETTLQACFASKPQLGLPQALQLPRFSPHFNPVNFFQVQVFESIGSTNSALWDLLKQGAPAGTTVIALTQTAGRGQRGRPWHSALGGLYLSLALTPDLPIAQAEPITLSSAWGIAAALRHYDLPVGIKWLNDLVVERRKLGGILTESRLRQGRIHQAVIGVGINWCNPVTDPGTQLQTILPDSSPIDSLEMVAAIVLWGLLGGYSFWQAQGTAALLRAYQHWLVNLGQQVQIGDRTAQIIGVTEAGALQVRFDSGNEMQQAEACFKPGEIHLGYELGLD